MKLGLAQHRNCDHEQHDIEHVHGNIMDHGSWIIMEEL